MSIVARLRGALSGQVAVIVTGSAAGQAITILAAPLLTRLYAPDDFGQYAVFVATVSFVSVGLTLRYEVAIPLPEDDEDAGALVWLSALIAFVVSAVLAFGLLVVPILLPHAGDRVASIPTLYALLPVSLAAIGLHQTLTYWAIRRQRFDLVSRSTVRQALGQAGGQLVAGLLQGGPVGLAAGHALGRVVAPFTIWRTLREDRALRRPRKLDDIGAAARRHRRFPLVTLWSSLINAGSTELPVWILAAAFAPSVVGWFALTTRVLQAPMALVGQAVGQVYYARAARESRDSLRVPTVTAARRLLAVATGPLALVLVAGPTLFGVVFGDAWLPAGRYAQWLAPWLLLVFVSSPISTLVFVLERQRAELGFQVALFVVRVASLGLGVAARDAELGIAAFGITNAVMRAGYLGWLMRLVGVDLGTFLSIVARRLLVVTVLAVPAIVGVTVLDGVATLVAVGVSGVALAIDALGAVQSREEA